MDSLKAFKDKLHSSRPQPWEMIPDIELYMDQVISYMSRQHIGLGPEGEENLTSAMINNYIKSGLLPRARGKKYGREHIGYLTAICLLKQVLSVGETGALMTGQMEHQSVEEFYSNYCKTLDTAFDAAAEEIDPEATDEELAQLALHMAVSSYVQMLSCKTILKRLSAEAAEKEKDDQAGKREEKGEEK